MREQSNSSLGDALRGLPLQSPDRDVWSQLAAELAPARTRRRTWPYFAAAAAVLIAVAAMLTMPHRRDRDRQGPDARRAGRCRRRKGHWPEHDAALAAYPRESLRR